MRKYFAPCLIMIFLSCCGCSYVQQYDVTEDQYGRPTAASIVKRLRCELISMVRNDQPDDPLTFHRKFILNENLDVEASLSLEVNDTGGISPLLSYMTPFSAATSVAWGGTLNLSASRDQKFTENLQYNTVDLFNEWKKSKTTDPKHWECPEVDTNLAGNLGLVDIVALADNSSGVDTSQPLSKGAFGGEIHFIVTKGLSSTGPTWTLVHFKGPGGLLGISQVNTDDLTIAFARHTETTKTGAGGEQVSSASVPRNIRAHELVLQMQANTLISILLTPH